MASQDIIKVNNHYLRAMFSPSTVNDEERTVEVVFATNTPVPMTDYSNGGRRFNEVLEFSTNSVRLGRFNSGAPLLDNHEKRSLRSVIGTVVKDSVVIEKNRASCVVKFSNRDEVRSIWQDVKDGILTNISVGYKVHKYKVPTRTTSLEDGELPEYRAIDWEPYEVSLVPIPADANAGVRSEKEETNNAILIKDDNDMDLETKDQANPLKDGVVGGGSPVESPPTKPLDMDRSMDEVATRAIIAERERQSAIRNLAKQLLLSEDWVDSQTMSGANLDAIRASALEEISKRQPTINSYDNVSFGKDERDKFKDVASTAIALRSGCLDEKRLSETTEGRDLINAARPYRQRKLVDIARECLDRGGENVRSFESDMELVSRAFTSSTSDFPVLLEGTARRVLLGAFETTPDTWRRLCTVGSVGDFREYNIVMAHNSFNRLDKVNENGEYKNLAIRDGEQQKVSVDTYGNMINVTRKMIVNDDLNAFTRLAQQLGRAAARSIEIDLYSLLGQNSGNGPTMRDGQPLFHSTHGNIAGTNAAISVSSLDLARVQMMRQKQLGGAVDDFLEVTPEILLCPVELGGNARVVIGAEYDTEVTSKFQVPNKVRNLIRDVVDTKRLTGTRWYLLANPNEYPVFQATFLNGVQTPYMEQQPGWNTDGLEWKIRFDYGVSAIDWRGALTNPGA